MNSLKSVQLRGQLHAAGGIHKSLVSLLVRYFVSALNALELVQKAPNRKRSSTAHVQGVLQMYLVAEHLHGGNICTMISAGARKIRRIWYSNVLS